MRKYISFDDECVNSSVFKKFYKRKVCGTTGKCDRCPWHDVENWRKRPRTDKYKNKRRDTLKDYE